MVIYWK